MFGTGALVLGLCLMATSVASVPAMADSTDAFTITAGGTGSDLPSVSSASFQLTGSFQFNPTTLAVSDVLFDGTLTSVGSAGTTFSETWSLGPLTALASGPNGWDSINFYGYAGSLGDVLEFSAYMYPDGSGGFVPSGGFVMSGNPSTAQLECIDNWGGEISPAPVPEPGTCMLLAAGLLVLVTAKLCRR